MAVEALRRDGEIRFEKGIGEMDNQKEDLIVKIISNLSKSEKENLISLLSVRQQNLQFFVSLQLKNQIAI